jgi:hypothetical protein
MRYHAARIFPCDLAKILDENLLDVPTTLSAGAHQSMFTRSWLASHAKRDDSVRPPLQSAWDLASAQVVDWQLIFIAHGNLVENILLESVSTSSQSSFTKGVSSHIIAVRTCSPFLTESPLVGRDDCYKKCHHVQLLIGMISLDA